MEEFRETRAFHLPHGNDARIFSQPLAKHRHGFFGGAYDKSETLFSHGSEMVSGNHAAFCKWVGIVMMPKF